MNARTISPRATLATGAALLVLWAGSWWASYAHLGGWALPVALAIAAVKAALVALFFMELLTEKASHNLALLSALALIVILIGFMVGDLATRAPATLSPPPVSHPLSEDMP